jgi:hypothetical protein
MRVTYLITRFCCALCCLGGLLLIQSCNDSSTTGSSASTDGAGANLTERTTINPQAVAAYKQKVNDKLNDYYFSVEVYETKKPLDYIVHLGYETMEDADTIHFPNLGYPIKPAIQKTTDSLSCYIGFIDPKGQFQYFKGVWVDKNGLNIRTVRTYDSAAGKKSGQ